MLLYEIATKKLIDALLSISLYLICLYIASLPPPPTLSDVRGREPVAARVERVRRARAGRPPRVQVLPREVRAHVAEPRPAHAQSLQNHAGGLMHFEENEEMMMQ